MTFEQKIWKYFIDKGLTEEQAAGIMGNLQAESGLIPYRVESDFSKGYSVSIQYTEKINKGLVSEDYFVNNNREKDKRPVINGKKYGPGYGLAQWTVKDRKQELYNATVKKGISIGDLNAQLDFLWQELSENSYYKLKELKKAPTILKASDIFLYNFENPKNASEQSKTRENMGRKIYENNSGKKYTDKTPTIQTSIEKSNKVENKEKIKGDNQDKAIQELKSVINKPSITYTDDMIITISVLGQITESQIKEEQKVREEVRKKKEQEDIIKNQTLQNNKALENNIDMNKQALQQVIDKNKVNKIKESTQYTPNNNFRWALSANNNTITSKFGTRTDPVTGKQGTTHHGVDIRAAEGSEIYAVKSGTVIHAGTSSSNSAYGKYVIIDHGNNLYTLYGHMSAVNVSKGQQVTPDSVIGYVGSTGKSTGNHLHFEVRKGSNTLSNAVNPLDYYNSSMYKFK